MGAQQLWEPCFTSYCSFCVSPPHSHIGTSSLLTSLEGEEHERRKAAYWVVHQDSRTSTLGDGEGLTSAQEVEGAPITRIPTNEHTVPRTVEKTRERCVAEEAALHIKQGFVFSFSLLSFELSELCP